MGGAVFEGKGSYLAGGTLWFRYNFIQANWRVVPYFQGGGAEAIDIDKHWWAGRHFNLGVAAGVRSGLAVTPHWTLNLECRYQHLSNGTLAKHDLGERTMGPMAGVSYLFQRVTSGLLAGSLDLPAGDS